MGQLIDAEVLTADRSPVGTAGRFLALTQTPEGRLRAETAGAASEAFLGFTGVKIVTIATALTVQAAAYAANDVIGGKITIANATRIAAGSGTIRSIVLNCKSTQTTAFDIIFFNADPAATTFTENGSIAVNAADFDKIFDGVVFAATTPWINVGTPSFAHASVALPFKLAAGTTIWACIISRGAPTFASTTDLTLTLEIEQN